RAGPHHPAVRWPAAGRVSRHGSRGGAGSAGCYPRLHIKICCVIKESVMSQVAVVIGGGQTLGEFLCRGLAAEGYRVAVVDIQSEKAARVADAINTEFGE